MPSRAEMVERIVRFDDLRRDSESFLDITLPGHVRKTMILVGSPGMTNDPTFASALPSEEFTIGMQQATTGNGSGLHSHETVEVFVTLAGTWRLYWIDDEGEGEVEMRPWDAASIPAGVWRGLSLVGEGEGLMLAVRGGREGGGVAWHPSVVERAADFGRVLDEQGNVVLEGR